MIRAAVLYMLAHVRALPARGSVGAAVLLLLVVGFASIIFLTTGNSTIQLLAEPSYRGRITALWSTAFVGSTPIGATIIGAIGATSPRAALTVGGAACGAAAITAVGILSPLPNQHPSDSATRPRMNRERIVVPRLAQVVSCGW